jgi:hypothetical protein
MHYQQSSIIYENIQKNVFFQEEVLTYRQGGKSEISVLHGTSTVFQTYLRNVLSYFKSTIGVCHSSTGLASFNMNLS